MQFIYCIYLLFKKYLFVFFPPQLSRERHTREKCCTPSGYKSRRETEYFCTKMILFKRTERLGGKDERKRKVHKRKLFWKFRMYVFKFELQTQNYP